MAKKEETITPTFGSCKVEDVDRRFKLGVRQPRRYVPPEKSSTVLFRTADEGAVITAEELLGLPKEDRRRATRL